MYALMPEYAGSQGKVLAIERKVEAAIARLNLYADTIGYS